MACCVVLNRLPMDIRLDDSAEKASNLSLSSRLQSGLNPDAQASLNDRSVLTNDSQHITADSRKPTESFKEPWTRLLLQAKERSKRSTKEAVKHSKPKNSDTGKETACDESTSSENQSSGTASLVEEKTDFATNCEQNASSGRELRQRRSVHSKKKSKRASSVDWDWSGSDSARKPEVPQNKKRKVASKRKRSVSVDRTFSGDSDDEEDSPSSKKLKKHICHLCHKTFPRPSKLRNHLYLHLSPIERPFRCDEEGCNKAYGYQAHLDRHKSTSHSDLVIAVGNVVCTSEGCGKVLATASGLKRHMKKMHSEEAFKFACPQCDQKFRKSKQLRYHIAEHDGEPPLRCEQCNAGAFSDAELRRHMRTHKTYPCKIAGCEKVFTNYPAFQKHIAEHNRCFSSLCCAHCNKVFATKDSLRKHVNTHVDNKPVFTCPYESCSRYYYHERNLRGHIRVKHEKNTSFTCSWEDCDKVFLSKRAFTKHTNVHKYGIANTGKKKEGPRARRKDAGKPKRSMATLLTGMKVPREIEQELLENNDPEELCDNSVEDISSTSASDYTASRNLLDASGLVADLQAKHCQADSNALKDNQDQHEDTEQNCNEMDLANSVCDEQNSNKTIRNFLPVDDIGIGTAPLIVEGYENSIADLSGRMFVVGEDGILIEVQDHPETLNEVNSKLGETVPDEAIGIPRDQILQGISGEEKEMSHHDSIVADITAQCELNMSTPDQSNCHGNADLSYNQTCADSVVQTISNGETCILSAMLCAETIVECQSSNAEREVLLVIPKAGQVTSIKEVFSVASSSSDAVMKALSGNVEIYSMAEKNSTLEVSADSCLHRQNDNYQEHLKKISIDDPSVSSILQPLIQNLVNQPGHCAEDSAGVLATRDEGNVKKSSSHSSNTHAEMEAQNAESPKRANSLRLKKSETSQVISSVSEGTTSNLNDSGKSLQIKSTKYLNPAYMHNPKKKNVDASDAKTIGKHKLLNPAYVQSLVMKFAGLICDDEGVKESVKKQGIPVKKSLQGPTQDLPDSGESSASEIDESRSDDSGSDDISDWDGDNDDHDNNASDGGNGDDEGEEEEEEEEDDSEGQVDEEDDADEEDEEDEGEDDGENDGDNGGAGQLNGGDDDNNNNDGDNNEGRSGDGGSDKEIDPVLRNGHCTLDEGSDFGVDRASSPRPAIFDDSDAGRSAQSDDLVIVEESETEAYLNMNNEEELVIRDHSQEMSPSKTTSSNEHIINESAQTISKNSQLKGNTSVCKPLNDTHLKGVMPEERPSDHILIGGSFNGSADKATPIEKNQSKDCSSQRDLYKNGLATNLFKDGILKDVPLAVLQDGSSDKNSFTDGASAGKVLSECSPKEKLSNICNPKSKLSKDSTLREVPSKDSSPEKRSSPSKNRRQSTRIRNLEAVKASQRIQTMAAVESVKKSRQSKRQQKPALEIALENSGDLNRDDSDGRDSYDSSAQIKERKQRNCTQSVEDKCCTMKGKYGSKPKRKMKIQEPTKAMKSVKVLNDPEAPNMRPKKQTTSKKSSAKINVSNVVESDSSDFEPQPKKNKVEKNEIDTSVLESEKGKVKEKVKKGDGCIGNSSDSDIPLQKRIIKQKVKKGDACIGNSSDSDIPLRKRIIKQALSDTEDSEELENSDFNHTDSDDPFDPSWKPDVNKKKTDGVSDTDSSEGSRKSPEKLANPLHVSVQGDEGLADLKVSPVSPSQDPLRVRYEGALESLKKERKPIACKQLSESAWISVLRLASKTIKLSPSAADD